MIFETEKSTAIIGITLVSPLYIKLIIERGLLKVALEYIVILIFSSFDSSFTLENELYEVVDAD